MALFSPLACSTPLFIRENRRQYGKTAICRRSQTGDMSKSTDERGRLYLPKDVRERFGEEYRVVELPDYVALFPIADDPLAAVEEAVGDQLEGKSVDELQEEARRKGRDEIAREREEHDAKEEEGA